MDANVSVPVSPLAGLKAPALDLAGRKKKKKEKKSVSRKVTARLAIVWLLMQWFALKGEDGYSAAEIHDAVFAADGQQNPRGVGDALGFAIGGAGLYRDSSGLICRCTENGTIGLKFLTENQLIGLTTELNMTIEEMIAKSNSWPSVENL